MDTGSEGVERTVLSMLREKGPMGFNELHKALEDQYLDVSRPRLSRCLEALVETGQVKKQVVAGWPPTTSYSVSGIMCGARSASGLLPSWFDIRGQKGLYIAAALAHSTFAEVAADS